jgi:hypothetical protein
LTADWSVSEADLARSIDSADCSDRSAKGADSEYCAGMNQALKKLLLQKKEHRKRYVPFLNVAL